MENVTIGKTVPIRSKGYKEAWLQDKICETPSILNLGDLELLYKEKPQDGGGRLDILLKDQTNNSMFEVEVMLGETDESHIIRTIEYWDREQRKYPKHSHTAVLVAETITSRFFNVIHLFSHAIPIIAIQAKMIDAIGGPILHFTKILDTYEEPETNELPQEEYDENQWLQMSPITVEAAKTLADILKPIFPDVNLHYVQNYIALRINGKQYVGLRKRERTEPLVRVWLTHEKIEKAKAMFSKNSDLEVSTNDNRFQFNADANTFKKYPEMMLGLLKLVKESWED